MPPTISAALRDEIAQMLPDGAEVVDAHTHLGRDEDGKTLTPEELLAGLDSAGATRAVAFPLHDPERHPAYRVPNDRVLSWASESDGRIVPFCRLDPTDDPLDEAERCIARGARGIKLHPRAQDFVFANGEADAIFALAEEARLPVLIHAGRGMPPIAEGLAEVARRHPRLVLILAHAGIADQAVFASELADHPGVLFDTSVFDPLDIRALLARVPAQRLVFASDPPYGWTPFGLYATLRACRASGVGESDLRGVVGGTIAEALDGRLAPRGGKPAAAATVSLPTPLLRIHAYGCLSFGGVMAGHPEAAREAIELARGVCRDPRPGASGAAIERVAPLLDTAARDMVRADRLDDAVAALFLAVAIVATESLPTDGESAGP